MKKKPKVLMVTPYLLYPPYSGGQTRSFNLIKHLADKCEITLFSYILPDQNPKHARYLKKYCRKVFTIVRGKTWTPRKILFTGFSRYSFLMANYYSPLLKKMIAEELAREKYDLVHVECFYLMPNIPQTSTPVILVDQTIEFAVYQHYVETLPDKLFPLKALLSIDVAKLKHWETSFWKKADTLIAVSGDDRKLMEKFSRRKVSVVPNGVDDSFIEEKKVKKYPRPTILFGVANFKWMQNKEGATNLLLHVWPKVKKILPEAELLISGRHSSEFLNKNKGMIFSPDSVRSGDVKNPEKIYRQSWVMVAPIKSGGGSRTKFFEAMACRLPIITTSHGIEGIEAKNGKEAVIADSYGKMVKKTVFLLQDEKTRERIGAEGRRLVKEKYSWRISAKKLLDIYQAIADEEK